MRLRRLLSVASGVVLAGSLGLASPAVAAPPDPSAVSVSSTNLAPGETFTVSFELYNADVSTITSVNASLAMLEASIVDVLDLVSCTGSISVCHAFGTTTYRGPVGDMAPGESRTVVFTFRVKDNTAAGSYTLEHQFVGGNFAFAPRVGPVLTVTSNADLAVSLDASPRGILTSRITYTVSVTNLGPSNASAVRIGGTYAAGLSWASGNGCVHPSGRSVQCDFASIPAGGTVTATFAVNAGLLALGSFTTSVSRVSSTPADPVSANDSDSETCSALTGLLVRC